MTTDHNALTGENSVRGRLARKRVELKKERTFDLPVPGYEDILFARYQQLDYGVLRRIGERQEKEKDKFLAEVHIAADTLVNACVGLYEVETGEPTGYRWSTAAARELFGVGEDELPEGATARQALLAVLPSDTSVMLHVRDYSELASDVSRLIDEDVAGESEGSTQE